MNRIRKWSGIVLLTILLIGTLLYLAPALRAQMQSWELVGVRPFLRFVGREASGTTVTIQEAAGVLSITGAVISLPGTMYAPSLTPAATPGAIGTTEQTFAVTGLATTDRVYVNGPAPTSLCPMVHARVSAANTLSLAFTTLTAAACTPAPGTYNVVALRS